RRGDAEDQGVVDILGGDLGDGHLVLPVEAVLERPRHPALVLEGPGPVDPQFGLEHADDHGTVTSGPTRSERALDLDLLVALDDVALLDVVVAGHLHAALGARADLLDVV